MRLIDCFVELIAYVGYLIKSSPAEQPNYERVRNDITQLVTAAGQHYQETNCSADDYQLAQFGVFAWIDEAILSSSWHEKQKWQSEQLQRSYFQTVDAGELFFDKLNGLQPQQQQVREVYYFCLALGFTGRFCNPGDEFLLAQLKNSNLKLLDTASVSGELAGAERLFPEAYDEGSSVGPADRKKRFGLGTIAAALVPVLLFALLFVIYGFVLDNVGENLIKSIRS